MSCFTDASAIVAILGKEPERDNFLNKLDRFGEGYVSPIVIYEAALALSRILGINTTEAEFAVNSFSKSAKLQCIAVDETISTFALQAFQTFGKGHHKAKLNMGDCFSYACAKARKVPLLCKGNDFIHTDIRIA